MGQGFVHINLDHSHFGIGIRANDLALDFLTVRQLDCDLVFLGIEAVRRKPLGEPAMIRLQQVGMALLGSLMVFVFYNDIARLVRQWL